MSWQERLNGWEFLKPSCIVDGVDFAVYEPCNAEWKVKKKFFSVKCGGPALKYLVGIHCVTYQFVFVSSAYPAGIDEPAIAAIDLEPLMLLKEKVLVDRRYQNNKWFMTALNYDCERSRCINSLRSHIERRIRKLRDFAILKNTFRSFNYSLHENIVILIMRLINYAN